MGTTVWVRQAAALAGIALILVAASGCISRYSRYGKYGRTVRPAVPTVPAKPTVPDAPASGAVNVPPAQESAKLRPGLVINVTVLVSGKSEIEVEAKRITDNGTIAMPLLGSVQVADLTLEEFCAQLTTSYKEFLVNPQVIAEFVRDDSKEGVSPWGTVTVLGRVKNPGKVSIPATRDMTVSAAIQKAGGFDTSAKETAIRVSRRDADGKLKTREVNLRSVGSEGRVENDIRLEPDDVVFVPELVF